MAKKKPGTKPEQHHLTLKHLMIAVAVYAVCLEVLSVLTALVAATIVLGLWLARSRAKPEDREGFLLRMLPLIPLSFPPALLATWLAACVALGHPPREADYHREIHPIVTELALLCTLIWLIVNLWFLGAMGWLAWRSPGSRGTSSRVSTDGRS